MSFTLDKYDKAIRIFLFFISAIPFIWMLYAYYTQNLGINPFETLMEVSGHAAMVFLLLSLTVTPVRRWLTFAFKQFGGIKWGKRLADWNVLIRSRRMLGLYSFFYCTIHGVVYLEFELDWLFAEFIWEIQERHFIAVGLVCWALLSVLSLTSPTFIQKKLKRWWRRIHKLIYPLAILASAHYILSSKPVDQTPFIYVVLVAVLLGHRALVNLTPRLKRSDDNGMLAERS